MIRPLVLITAALVFIQIAAFSQAQPNAIPKKDFYQQKKTVNPQKTTQSRSPVIKESNTVAESLDNTHYLDKNTGEIVPVSTLKGKNTTESIPPKADVPSDKNHQPSPKG